jgi:DNA/RNA endonuclease YhcR with UshA esterase domain
MLRQLSITVGLLAVMTATASSQAVKPAVSPGAPTTVGTSVKKDEALINGTAADVNSVPLPNATVRLRNLADNRIEQVAISDQFGKFSFIARPEIPYVVEVSDRLGHLLAVGDVIIVQAGEVAAAAVTIPSRLPALAGLFGQTANSVLSAASLLGMAVVDPDDPPLSPEK